MLTYLKRLLLGDRRPVRGVVPNEVPGRLVYSQESDGWETEPKQGLPFQFFIAGDRSRCMAEIAPDSRLIEHAEEIAKDPEAFLREVRDFLIGEIDAQPRFGKWAQEVSDLKVATVCLMWPERPDDGMIQFTGPADHLRLWRCDYIGRKPKWLGFDT